MEKTSFSSKDLISSLLLFLFIFAPTISFSQDETASDTNEKPELKYPAAPEPYSELIKVSNANIDLYDPKKDPRRFDGETHFKFSISYSYRYKYTTNNRNGEKTVFVRPRYTKLDVQCTNQIFIPEKYQGDTFWKARLVAHEFEHIRLNCDVRPKLLARELVKQLDKLEFKLKDGEKITTKMIDEKIERHVASIRTEIVRIIQAENDRLDELTKHGQRHLVDFDKFFAERYSNEVLESYKFKYLKESQSLIDSKQYAR